MQRKIFLILACWLINLTIVTPTIGQDNLTEVETLQTENSPYFQRTIFKTADGISLERTIINGPPTPPPGFEIDRTTVTLPKPSPESGVATLNVPAYNWSFGCSATSAAMIAAYYDRTTYPNMYTGPTNGGVMPLDNSSWPDVVINSETRHQCPLSATRNGLDSRSIKGHVDDYWYQYNAPGPDPYDGQWTEHTPGDCTGDFMKTNKWFSSQGFNIDGATTFWNYTNGSPITSSDLESLGVSPYDGGYGLKLFYESRGYTVQSMYNQFIYGYQGNTLGFTYAQYKAEIDAGRPVMIHVEGHTMVGIGYDDSAGNLMYINDTWDYSTHSMTWGGTYGGMPHYAVTIVRLASQTPSDSSFSWPMFLPATTHKQQAPPPESLWGVGSDVCCQTSSATFSMTSSGVTKKSYIADCYQTPTWEGWASTTPGTKTFSWSLTSAKCGSYSGAFNYTLEDGKSYYFQLELDANYDLVIYVYIGTASNATASLTQGEQAEPTTIANIVNSMQLTDTITLNVPRDAFKGASCKK